MGVSLNGATPKHPKMIILVGKPMVVGYHHFRKPQYLLRSLDVIGKKNAKNEPRHPTTASAWIPSSAGWPPSDDVSSEFCCLR